MKNSGSLFSVESYLSLLFILKVNHKRQYIRKIIKFIFFKNIIFKDSFINNLVILNILKTTNDITLF